MSQEIKDRFIDVEITRILRNFRPRIVENGDAKLLDKYDKLIKQCTPGPLKSINNGLQTTWAILLTTLIFVLPWGYGIYKLVDK